ncbi:hypothetical protein A45J_0907 [hot springs metagenome]|uniref:Uncharacterized protein n=1 Tax=hot springs metagenome TaxID=433727 RepID=A0A5J4KVF5_9ZZZZ
MESLSESSQISLSGVMGRRIFENDDFRAKKILYKSRGCHETKKAIFENRFF